MNLTILSSRRKLKGIIFGVSEEATYSQPFERNLPWVLLQTKA
ncbi:hypothetical protein ACVIQY_002532 [Bradyrhizobium sp. USDA 3051]